MVLWYNGGSVVGEYLLYALLGFVVGGGIGYYVGATAHISGAFNNLWAHFRIRNR